MEYNDIINQITSESIINLMTKLGAHHYIEKENYIIFPTLCHNINSEEASMKLYYYKNSKLFICYTNCETQNIFTFLKNYYNTRNIEYDWYQDIYSVILDLSNLRNLEGFSQPVYKSLRAKYENVRKEKQLPEYSKTVLDCFVDIAPVEWIQDGISEQTMKKFGIKYSISQNKIIIPHYDIDNRLIGIRGRALDKWEVENIGKYAPIKIENIWYKHPLSMNLYGLNLTKNNIKKTGICYLVESEKACLQLESFSIPNCGAAVCGSSFNKYQLNILLKECHPLEIIICFDNEEKKGKEDYFFKLYNICKKYNNYCNFSFIYDREGLTKLKDSPTDCGEETFLKLIERRVKVK